MKKLFLYMFVFSALWTTLRAQTLDTVTGARLPGYHYTTPWFDSCAGFYDSSAFLYLQWWSPRGYGVESELYCIVGDSVEHPAAITGFGVWVLDTFVYNGFGYTYRHPITLHQPRVPEYVYVFKRDEIRDTVMCLASARWDTATPKIHKVPARSDTARYGFFYFKLFEVHLKDSFVYVDPSSVFYLMFSHNNGVMSDQPFTILHEPISYGFISTASCYTDNFCPRNHGDGIYNSANGHWTKGFATNRYMSHWGPIMPMIDYVMVHTLSADSTMGTAHPNCPLSKHVNQTIYATPNRGYYFLRWDDGDTNNPRTVFVTQDTTFTALFSDLPAYSVETMVDDPMHGTVTGGGRFFQGEAFVLTANPIWPYRFSHWQDGDTSNPRTIYASRNDVYTAYFVEKDIYTLTANPNIPERGTVTGGGLYHDGDTATLTATAAAGYRFSCWVGEDYNYHNPRRVVVSQDTLLIARFSESQQGIAPADEPDAPFSLTPNPTRGSVTVEIKDPQLTGRQARLELTDMAGRKLQTLRVDGQQVSIPLGQYAAGTYYVTLISPKATYTGKLVIE